MLELYSPVPALTGFYSMVAHAARDWQGDGDILTTIEMT